jgi:hypothetical protein
VKSRYSCRENVPQLFDDTWVWNGTDWTMQNPADRPSARERSGMAYDPVSRVLVLFGGDGVGGNLGDTWTWDGANWTCAAGCS